MSQVAENPRVVPRPLGKYLAQISIVFAAYVVAGKLGQATTSIRSSNLGPVWPAYGVALAAVLVWGYRVWVGIAAAAFLVAFLSPVPLVAAAGQAAGGTLAALLGAFLLRRLTTFQSSLARLRDALALIAIGALGSAIVSASIGMAVLYATNVHPYSGMAPAWMIYWLGDATGVLLITPVVLTFPNLLKMRSLARIRELAALLVLLTIICLLVYGDLPLIPVRLHLLAFVVLPFVIWAAIRFGVSGVSVATLLIAAIATVETAFGSGPFTQNTPFINAVLLDVFFAVLAVSGMTLAAAIAEREQSEREREWLARKQAAMEERLRFGAIVESSDDAIIGTDVNGVITEWNRGAERLYGYSVDEVIGKRISLLLPPDNPGDLAGIVETQVTIKHYESMHQRKDATRVEVSLTLSPITDTENRIVGASVISRDISERKRAEEALASVSRRLIAAQDLERTRIARDLHDDIGQRLALLAMELQQLHQSSADLPPKLRIHTGELWKQTSDIASDIQSLSHELHLSKLQYLGLLPAMRAFCREFGNQQKAEVDLLAGDLPTPLPIDVSLCLFRVLQEALHNAAKHSGIRRFEVGVWGSSDEIHLTVSDSGVGFNSEAAKKAARGLGIISMEERLKLVNGTLAIDSKPGRGTTIHARAPLHTESESRQTAG